jgi:hypothetical protein
MGIMEMVLEPWGGLANSVRLIANSALVEIHAANA